MATGSESLDRFLGQQVQFTTSLCKQAVDLSMPLLGAHPCPNCGQGVLQLRNGKSGKFWAARAILYARPPMMTKTVSRSSRSILVQGANREDSSLKEEEMATFGMYKFSGLQSDL